MIIDNEGTYTLRYTATDDCGKQTTVDRELVVERIPPTYRTVLYEDGTFIINESSYDIDSNIAEHGEATNVYVPFDPNGETNIDKYIFTDSTTNQRPWYNERRSILSVEIGSEIKPTSTAHWFDIFTKCVSFNLELLDTSEVTDMASMFAGCSVATTLDVSNFDTHNVRNMIRMFAVCDVLQTIYASTLFTTNGVTQSANMFTSTFRIVGGAGTTWSSSNPVDKTYARIDGGTSNPGYFTLKSA